MDILVSKSFFRALDGFQTIGNTHTMSQKEGRKEGVGLVGIVL